MTTCYPSDAAIDRLVERFLDCTLPKAEWTHAAHFAATLRLLRDGTRDLAREMPALIRAYNESVGGTNSDSEGYHETITQASIRAARAFLVVRPVGEPLHDTIDALMISPFGRSAWPLDHWTRERLFSVEARRGWVEPDLQPLPF